MNCSDSSRKLKSTNYKLTNDSNLKQLLNTYLSNPNHYHSQDLYIKKMTVNQPSHKFSYIVSFLPSFGQKCLRHKSTDQKSTKDLRNTNLFNSNKVFKTNLKPLKLIQSNKYKEHLKRKEGEVNINKLMQGNKMRKDIFMDKSSLFRLQKSVFKENTIQLDPLTPYKWIKTQRDNKRQLLKYYIHTGNAFELNKIYNPSGINNVEMNNILKCFNTSYTNTRLSPKIIKPNYN